MKLKIDHNSIKFKIALYFVLFAIILMLILWSLQVLFLNVFYQSMKESQTQSVANNIEQAYKHNTLSSFAEEITSIAADNDIYLYIAYTDNTPFLISDRGSSQQDYSDEIQEIRNTMITKNLKSVSLSIKSLKPERKLLACGSLLTSDNKPNMIAYIISPLWPMSSTISILQRQLLYVTAISLVISLMIAFYLSDKLATPIRNITRSADKLAEGEYGVTFQGNSYTELNNLADTLTRASIELEKSTSLQKDLIANVSHDLRTPLTMVKSYAEMIRDLSGDNPVKREEHLQVIIEEADRLNLLVSDMLTLSKMQSGAIVINRTVFDLHDAIESILMTYKLLKEEEGYTINFECPKNLIVNGDAERIKQVFANLINNALKFCGEDKTVNVIIKKKGRTALCQVQDHGIGIPEDELLHIWERYYKASTNMVRSSTGTGLGLSIVKEILSLHKVRYGVNSKVGEGTTFWFEMNIE